MPSNTHRRGNNINNRTRKNTLITMGDKPIKVHRSVNLNQDNLRWMEENHLKVSEVINMLISEYRAKKEGTA